MRRRTRFELNQWKLCCIVGGGFVVFYVFLSSQIIAFGYRIQKAETKYHELMTVNQNYRADLERLCSPVSVRRLLEEHGISMVVPSEWCSREIEEPGVPPGIRLSDGKAEANTR